MTWAIGTRARLRVLLNSTGDPSSTAYQLESKKNGSGSYAAVPVGGTTTYPIPTFQSAGTKASATSAVTATMPASFAAGDLLFMAVQTSNEAVATPPSGWTEVSASPQGTGTAVTALSTRLTLYAKIAAGSETSINIGDAGDHGFAITWALRGTHQTLATALHVVAGDVASSNTTSVTFPGGTTTVNNCLILNVIADGYDNTSTTRLSSISNGNLGSVGIASAMSQGTTSGTGGGVTLVTGTLATAGSIGGTTATLASSTKQGRITIAVRPPADVTNDIYIDASANIAASAATSTTSQLTGGSGSFTAGRISDDTNPLPGIDIGSGGNTELEWSINTQSPAAGGDYYDFRVTAAGVALDTYTATPRLTLASAASYTLTAAQGSYTLSGQTAALRTARKLTAAQGAYALSGQAAGLKIGFKVSAVQGAYALTGQDAAMRASRSLAAAQGSYALSGQTATLKIARKFVAAQGAYALTGQAAILVHGVYLTAAQGSYALTGQAAGLLGARRLAAAQGSYALNGQAATLTYFAPGSYSLTAAQGSYALTGQAVALRASRILTAAQGAYSITGQAATLTYGSITIASICMSFYHQSGSGVVQTGGSSVESDTSLSVSSGFPSTGDYPVIGSGTLVTGTFSGTAQLRLRAEVAGVVTARAGMTLIVEKVA